MNIYYLGISTKLCNGEESINYMKINCTQYIKSILSTCVSWVRQFSPKSILGNLSTRDRDTHTLAALIKSTISAQVVIWCTTLPLHRNRFNSQHSPLIILSPPFGQSLCVQTNIKLCRNIGLSMKVDTVRVHYNFDDRFGCFIGSSSVLLVISWENIFLLNQISW